MAGVPGVLVAGLGCVAGVVTPGGVAGVSVGLVVVQATSIGVVVGVTCVCVSTGAVAVGVASGGFGVSVTVFAGVVVILASSCLRSTSTNHVQPSIPEI